VPPRAASTFAIRHDLPLKMSVRRRTASSDAATTSATLHDLPPGSRARPGCPHQEQGRPHARGTASRPHL